MNAPLLTVNVGNTNVSVAWCTPAADLSAGQAWDCRRLEQWPTKDFIARSETLRSRWRQLITQRQVAEIRVGCVVESVEPVLVDWSAEAGVTCRRVRHTDLPLRVDVPAPERVGIDRLLNCSAAWRRFGRDCLVVDLGTAVTWDLVVASADRSCGVFGGGVIAPGLDTMAHALPARTALPWVEPVAVDAVLGRDTVACLRSGLWFGFLASVEGIIARIHATLPEPPLTILTGGGAHRIAPGLSTSYPVISELTHEGLAILEL
jgi:pantothenate kinase type III